MEQDREKIRKFTGIDPPTCPWRCVDNPFVSDAITLHSVREHGTHWALMGGIENAPYELVQYLAMFSQTYDATLNDIKRQQHEEHKQEMDKQRRENKHRSHANRR